MTRPLPAPVPRATLVRRTLWRIESDLSRAPSLADLAAGEGVSRFHLARAFFVVTGWPVMAYVRARRLSEAASQIRRTGDSLLTVALDAGYDSHEGFRRAFRDHFGFPPSAVRADPGLVIKLQEPLTMTTETHTAPEPRIVNGPTLRIVGVSEVYTMETRARIPAQWERTAEEYGTAMCGGETYGVCCGFNGTEFSYLVGVAAERSGGLDWPDRLELPGARYAVFDHKGHISGISETWQAIFENWAPNSGMQIAEAPQFELYAADFDLTGSGGVSIWIPVEGS